MDIAVKTEPGAAIMEGTVLRPRQFQVNDDPETFLRGFKRLARANGWTEEKQRSLIPALFGEAHEWLARELEDDDTLTTVDLICKRITDRLLPAEKRRTYLHEFYEVQMKETDEPRETANRLRTLLAAAMPDLQPEAQEQMVAEQLPRVVPSKWRLRVLDSEATTVEGLIRRIERIKTTEQLKGSFGAVETPVQNMRRVECFVCHKPGHKASQCRKRVPPAVGGNNVGAGRSDVVCFQCGGRGHVKRQCPSPSQAAGGQPTQHYSPQPRSAGHPSRPGQPAHQQPQTSGQRFGAPREVRRLGMLPAVELTAAVGLNGIQTEGVLDTGSSVSLVNERLVEDLCLQREETEAVKCLAANGTEVEVTGQVEVELTVGKTTIMHRLFVSAGLTDTLLLGLDVLSKLNMVIHCGTREMMIGDEVVGEACSAEVLNRCPVVCCARSQTFVCVRKVSGEQLRLFQPCEVMGVKIAPALHRKHQGTPVRILNLSEEEVIIPAGTVLGRQECVLEVEPEPPEDIEMMQLEGPKEDIPVREQPEDRGQSNRKPRQHEVDDGEEEEDHEPELPMVEHLDPEDKSKIQELLREYQDVFSQSAEDIGAYKGRHQLVIKTTGTEPVHQRAYRTPLHLRGLLKEKLEVLQGQGVIEDSTSPWSSPIVMIRKKDGGIRVCCDYRAVNAVIQHDSFPLPRIEDLLHATRKARVYSVLDQRAAYWAVPIEPDSREVTAFISEYGLKQWTRQPFGLKTSPGMFQRIMEDVLEGLNWETAVVYLDDVIVFSPSMEEHLSALREVLDRFRQAGLKLHPDKCQVAVKRVNFLGHQLDETGMRPAEDKVEAVKNWPRPTNKKDVRRFLGLVGYYRQYLPHFADSTASLTELLKEKVDFE